MAKADRGCTLSVCWFAFASGIHTNNERCVSIRGEVDENSGAIPRSKHNGKEINSPPSITIKAFQFTLSVFLLCFDLVL